MNPSPALSIVVPLYRSSATLPRLLTALSALEVEGGHEIVLVHDGSPDDTLEVARTLLPGATVPVTLVDLARNFGEHNAVLAGLRHARGSWVVTMDDDLQNPPAEALRLMVHARDHHLDCVFGDYTHKQHAAWRNLGSRFNSWMAGLLMDKPPGLYLSSFRCMSAFLARELGRHEGPFPYIDGLILQCTQRVGAIKVAHVPRTEGESGYSLRKLVHLWLSMFVNFSVMPLRAATVLGLGLGVCGLAMVILVTIEYFVNGTDVRGWSSLMATILLFSGTQLVVLGLLGEYLGRVFLTLNRRPQSVVREVVRAGTRHPAAGEGS